LPQYEAAVTTTLVGASAGSVLAAFRAGTRPCYIYEIHLFGVTAPTTSGSVGLTRSTAIGTGTLTQQLGQTRDKLAIAALGGIVTNWGTAAPTVAASPYNTLRRWAQPASIGNGIIWVFDRVPLEISANNAVDSELCLINLVATAPGTYNMSCIWEE
jgi:hypothetical protein